MAEDQKFYCQEASCHGDVLELTWDVPEAAGSERYQCPNCGWHCTPATARRFCAKRPKHAPAAQVRDDAAYAVNPEVRAEAERKGREQMERELPAVYRGNPNDPMGENLLPHGAMGMPVGERPESDLAGNPNPDPTVRPPLEVLEDRFGTLPPDVQKEQDKRAEAERLANRPKPSTRGGRL